MSITETRIATAQLEALVAATIAAPLLASDKGLVAILKRLGVDTKVPGPKKDDRTRQRIRRLLHFSITSARELVRASTLSDEHLEATQL